MKDILIFSGQSNMQGQTEAVMPSDPVPHAWEYRFLTHELCPLAHPVGEDVGDGLLLAAHEGKGSLIPAFCRAYTQETGHEVVAVHAARGATMVCEWFPGTARFETFAAKCRGAIEAVSATDTVGRISLVWLQGESDACASVSKADYMSGLRRFREAVAATLPLDEFCLIRVGKFTEDARDLEIIRAQEALCHTPDFLMLTRITGMCTQDIPRWINPFERAHYNNAAMELIGTTAGKHLAFYTKGIPFQLEEDPYGEVTE